MNTLGQARFKAASAAVFFRGNAPSSGNKLSLIWQYADDGASSASSDAVKVDIRLATLEDQDVAARTDPVQNVILRAEDANAERVEVDISIPAGADPAHTIVPRAETDRLEDRDPVGRVGLAK